MMFTILELLRLEHVIRWDWWQS